MNLIHDDVSRVWVFVCIACMHVPARVSTIPFHVCVHIIICMYVCGIGCTIESKE